jgi:hypothetical protein
VPTGITDQVAKESSDSTASDHPIHDQSDQAAKAHKSAPVRPSTHIYHAPDFVTLTLIIL